MKIDKIVKLAKEVLIWSNNYWKRSHQLGEETYSEQDINEAFNKWCWAEHDLKQAILEYEDEKKKEESKPTPIEVKAKKVINELKKGTPMFTDKENQFSRLTMENSYGVKTVVEYNTEDPELEDCFQAFYAGMIAATWGERTVLEGMIEFAKNRLEVLGPREDE